MNNTPKISVIIPTYNRLALLKITLKNIFDQTLSAYEIIVVDDHSSDGTYAYLSQELPDKVIALQTKGKGPGAARNTGLAVATGDYIKFFDSDDLMTLNSLQSQFSCLQASKQALVYSPYVQAYWQAQKWVQADAILQYKAIPKHSNLRQCMAYGFFTVIPAMLFKRELLTDIGPWREDIVAYEDWDYLWRIGNLVPSPLHTNKCLMLYRIHGGQTTEENFSNKQRDMDKLKCLEETIASINKKNWNRALLKSEHAKTQHSINNSEISFKFKLIQHYKRLRNKRERLLTKTNWERMHGPNANPSVFQDYLKLL